MPAAPDKSRRSAKTIVAVALVAAILVLLNVILAGMPMRLDLTEGKEFTISRATREVLGDLRDLVTVTVYMSSDLPPQLSTLRRQVSDLLDEYRNYGKGRVQIDFVDPAKNPEIEARLRTLGIPQITAQTVEQDQLQVVNIYLGLQVSYLDRQEVIPVVQDTYTLEYDLTSAILKVSREESYVVGLLAGPTVHDPATQLTGLRSLLEKQFEVQVVNLGAGDEAVSEEVDLLLVAGPSQVPDAVKYQIDQFLMRGGRVIFLIDPVRLPEGGGLQAYPLESGIEDLLAHYGVRVQNALVVDRALNAPASFSSGFLRYTLPYPYWPKAVPDLLNSENPVTSRLESLVLPWAAPIEVDVPVGPGDPLSRIEKLTQADRQAREEMAQKLGVDLPPDQSAAQAPLAQAHADGSDPLTASVLARTSPRAWSVSGRYDLNPQQDFVPGQASAQILAVALSGTFHSFYENHPVPSVGGGEMPEAGTGAVPPSRALPAPALESPDTRIIVVGNALFATDSFLGQFPENSLFLQNSIDWLTLGDRLISIRSRGATDRPLKPLSEGAKSTVKLLVILGAPLLVIGFGLVRMSLKRRTTSALEVAMREA